MAIINQIQNSASITYGGNTITSNAVTTALLLAPTILKAVDKLTANVGDTLTYTITVNNVSLSAISNIPLSDTLAAGITYNTGSFTVNGTAATPTVSGTTLSYTIPSIASLGSAVVQFKVTIVGGSSTS